MESGDDLPMTTVHSVTGPIDAGARGVTLIHEHFFSADEMVFVQWPHVRSREDDYGLALATAAAVKRHGVQTVVDPTAAMLGRDVRSLARLSADSGLHV